ncbi:putative DEAD/DEAH box helicase [Aspergillus mulundensis]|uniref:Uncharacterized protein n=1 Tax=Aspergillus mulundensis TaxID=1810919 RepID=A0A3D8RRN7_9EURO|nr:Uncharacterized protein DSM5745_06734 [Aspergillus mulundensis]RDW76742.1 Uncharacterized protein DSM5745_06734 [Aspergillus mulundensis]
MADTAKLLEWFESLSSRTLDLVGDYAGDELFLVEGDSLLLQCFSDHDLDFTNGLQLLHATSLVEKFLANLRQRKCVFHVVFFADHAQACIPLDSGKERRRKYRLAREAILQHLTQNLATAVPEMQVKCFNNYQSTEFQQYLQSVGAYFLMCHDGSTPFVVSEALHIPDDDRKGVEADSLNKDMEASSISPKVWPTKIMMRSMIHWFICNGYNIAILNSLECRDSKVMAMILEGSATRASKLYELNDPPSNAPVSSDSRVPTPSYGASSSPYPSAVSRGDKLLLIMEPVLLGSILDMHKELDLQLTQREWATVITIGTMLQSSQLDKDNTLRARAMLMHAAILSQCKLSERAVVVPRSKENEAFLQRYARKLRKVLTSELWQNLTKKISSRCDLADAVDGRLFLETARVLRKAKRITTFGQVTLKKFEALRSVLLSLFSIDIQPTAYSDHKGHASSSKKEGASQPMDSESVVGVLPFQNPVIDAHLKPVSLVTSDATCDMPSGSMSRIFQELTHWHNHKRPLDHRANIALTEREKMFSNRRNQRFMTDVARYAGSLTNAVGGSLMPEAVFVKVQVGKPSRQFHVPSSAASAKQNTSTGHRKHGKSTKVSVRDQIAAQQKSKEAETFKKHVATWSINVESFEKMPDLVTRYVKVKGYLANLPAEKRSALQAEILAYMVSILANAWVKELDSHQLHVSIQLAALIWQIIQQIASLKKGITEDIAKHIHGTVQALKLPQIDLQFQEERKLSFNFVRLDKTIGDFGITLSPTEFQLVHAGPYLDRSMGSAPDPRVHDFEPDKWQRDVLDQIDARRSLFVVAPTSAGKTFISFYAMKQVLEDDDDGVLVYVAPTKALVNQIAAEVQARFSKSYNTPGKSVWAIHTRDHRINNPTGCQVLVTVPHILQIMLLAPSNAQSWSPRVKRIIFDEVHCIGQAEDGVIWEQLLLLAPCPIIALSATIGNPIKFRHWLEMTQKANGLELKMIEHKARYSDLRKYVYHPPAQFLFNGLSTPQQLAPLGLDLCPNMAFMHPVASLIDRSRGLPDDLTLEPRDCLMLWQSMEKHSSAAFPVDKSLDPNIALPSIIKKADVIEWEARLKQLLREWMNDTNSPFEEVVKELSASVSDHTSPSIQVSFGEIEDLIGPRSVRHDSILDTTLPLICSLHAQGALPVLFFNYDRSYCEKICDHLLTELEASEDHWKASSPVWKQKMAKFQEWEKLQEKQIRVREPKKAKGKRNRGDDEEERLSKTELARSASKDSSMFETFDPSAPVSGFHFANEMKLSISEFKEYATQLRCRDVPERLITALRRGIGVHHSGMNRKYRQVCEILFRKGYLRVVIATGTLALGINMPCKTVVFSGNSVFLTALGFRQAAGRAGRRGFDFLGNVVFQCIPQAKVCRLLSSKLPELNGHFPLTTTLVLRLMTLLHESKASPYAVKAVNSILSCPRIYLGGDESKHTVLHHLRFSIEYLRRNWLLSKEGAPLNFAGIVGHLYYTGSSSFAFHALLSQGYFHQLCRNIGRDTKKTLRTLMLVLSHLFGRYHLRPSILENWKARDKSTSVVVLQPLPNNAAKILKSHNKETLSIYSAYVTTFIDQHIRKEDCVLPLTGMKCGGLKPAKDVSTSLKFLPATQVTSAFVALSGHRDGKWKTISELCTRVRSGVWLEQSVIPHLQVSPEEGQVLLNAYLYDFYKHGNVHALMTENMIRRGDLWYLLNDFSLVLATIVTSLENFMKLSPGLDPDLLETMGSGDTLEDDLDDELLEMSGSGNSFKASLPQRPHTTNTSATASRKQKLKKSKVADSWDDSWSDDSDLNDNPDQSSKDTPQSQQFKGPSNGQENDDSDAFLEGEGLLQVLKAFRMLREEFNAKFKAIWA